MPNLVTLLFLLFIALVLWPCMRGWRKSGWLAAAWACLFLLVGLGPLPQWMSAPLQRSEYYQQPTPGPGNHALVLLGAGDALQAGIPVFPSVFGHSRIAASAAAFRRISASGGTCTIIVSGGDPDALGKTEAAVYAERLVEIGIPPDRIQREDRSLNTYQNAEYTAEILRRASYDRVFIVTSGMHMRRSLLYFAQFGINATPIASDLVKAPSSPLPLGFNFAIADLAFHEYIGIARLRVYSWMGWNKRDEKKAWR